VVVVFDQLSWLDGVEALLIDFLFNDVQNLLPGIHEITKKSARDRISTVIFTGVEKPSTTETQFSQMETK
jgi:hypothetical protein